MDISWQVSGSGKAINSSVKELMVGIGRVLGQVDASTSKTNKLLEEQTKVFISMAEMLQKIHDGIQTVVDNTNPVSDTSTNTLMTPAKLMGTAPGSIPPPPPGFSVPPVRGGVAPKLMPVPVPPGQPAQPAHPVPPPASAGLSGFDLPAGNTQSRRSFINECGLRQVMPWWK